MQRVLRCVLVCLTLTNPIAVLAQTEGTAEERAACQPDVQRLCNEFGADKDKIIACLNQKVRQLSPACRLVMLSYAQEQICIRDINRWCAEAAGDREKTFICLKEKQHMLTASCRNAVEVYARQRR
jgi:hypothetical protein